MSEEVKQAIMEFQTAINFKTATVMPMEYSIDIENAKVLLKYIEQLQQENKELKEKEKFKSCGFSASTKELYRLATVLDEFEKWLEKRINFYKNNLQGYSYKRYKEVLDKLQELKEGKK